jgi:hypothetical protein
MKLKFTEKYIIFFVFCFKTENHLLCNLFVHFYAYSIKVRDVGSIFELELGKGRGKLF